MRGEKTFPYASAINRVIACLEGMLGMRLKIVLTLMSYFFQFFWPTKHIWITDEISNRNTVVLRCVVMHFFSPLTRSLFQQPFKGWVVQIKRPGPPPPVLKVYNTKGALLSPLTAILYCPAPVPSANPCIFMSTHQDVFLHHSPLPASTQRAACRR